VHALDGLRAAAICLVLVHHLGIGRLAVVLRQKDLWAWGSFAETVGTSGVELFFVLSGLVLAAPYLRKERTFHAGAYLRRRMVRLFPPYLVAWLVSGLVIYLGPSLVGPRHGAAALPAFTVRDWLLQLGIIYFGEHWNYPCWSLTVEALFYLFLPGLLMLVARLPARPSAQLAALMAMVALSVSLPLVAPILLARVPPAASALLLYAPCFAAGLLLGRRDLPPWLAWSLVAAGALLVWIACLVPPGPKIAGYALLYTGLVSRALDPRGQVSRRLGRWPLVWLGERSYSLFLIHAPVITVVLLLSSRLLPPEGLLQLLVVRFLAGCLSLLAAMIIFTSIERRFARGLVTAGAFWPRRPVRTGQAAGS